MLAVDGHLQCLKGLFRAELKELHQNAIKESILLIQADEVEYILWVSSDLGCSPLSRHSAVSLFAQFMRLYHTQKKETFEYVHL